MAVPVSVACWVSMENTVAPREPSEVGLFEPGGRHYDGTPAQQALGVSMLPVVVLGGELGRDETFRRLALEVVGDGPRAYSLAARYARSGARRWAIAAMLIEASVAPPDALTTRLMNMSQRRAVFLNQALEDADPRNALQQRYIAKLFRGARIVARRGAHRCLECGAFRVSGYCDSHYPLEHGQHARDSDAARVILRAVAEQLGISSHGPQARRARRRNAA